MNREIKFRGLKVNSKGWVYGSLVLKYNKSYIVSKALVKKTIGKKPIWIEIEVIPETVGQFTGLLDKNGTDIYEGDIVTYKRSVGNWTGQFITTTHEIVFSEEVFAFVMKYGDSYIKLRKHWGYEYEVVVNIHENPELLK